MSARVSNNYGLQFYNVSIKELPGNYIAQLIQELRKSEGETGKSKQQQNVEI